MTEAHNDDVRYAQHSLPDSWLLSQNTARPMPAVDVEKGEIEVEHVEHALPNSLSKAADPMTMHQPIMVISRSSGDPVALGFFSFATTMFVSSIYNAKVKSITEPNMVVGMSLFSGGLTQLLAGMWEFPRGQSRTFSGTAFAMSGSFWLAYATIFIPFFGVQDAFENVAFFQNAVGFFHMSWVFLTFCLFLGTLRMNLGLASFFFMLDSTFILLATGAFTGIFAINRAAGFVGVVTSAIAFYDGLASLLAADASPPFRLPMGRFPWSRN